MTNLGDAIKKRRIALGLKQSDAAQLAGITVRTYGRIERSEATGLSSLTAAGIERALQWAPGSLDTIRDGGEPTELTAEPSAALGSKRQTPTIPTEALKRATEAAGAGAASMNLPTIDLSRLIPKSALESLSRAAIPEGALESIRSAAEATASGMLPSLIELLDTHKRSELTYDILDYLEANGHDVDALIQEQGRGTDNEPGAGAADAVSGGAGAMPNQHEGSRTESDSAASPDADPGDGISGFNDHREGA